MQKGDQLVIVGCSGSGGVSTLRWPMADARAMLLWALTVLLASSYNRNPLYGLLLLLLTLYVESAAVGKGRVLPFQPWRFALVVIPLGALLNASTSHYGDMVLFSLPGWLPLLGGAITLEALAYGAINGLNLAVIVTGFAAFNHYVAAQDLLRLTPKALHQSGVVIAIAMTFVPQTIQSLQRIREAQAVRGHRLRRLRDWLPIVTPLLVSALERALGLAEAMVSRGHGATTGKAQPVRLQGLLALGLLTLLGGWLGYLFAPQLRAIAMSAIILAVGVLGVAFHLAGRAVRRTVYRARRWQKYDTVIVCGSVIVLATLFARRALLSYSPYPQLGWPGFDPLVGLGLMGLVAPALGITTQRQARSAALHGINKEE